MKSEQRQPFTVLCGLGQSFSKSPEVSGVPTTPWAALTNRLPSQMSATGAERKRAAVPALATKSSRGASAWGRAFKLEAVSPSFVSFRTGGGDGKASVLLGRQGAELPPFWLRASRRRIEMLRLPCRGAASKGQSLRLLDSAQARKRIPALRRPCFSRARERRHACMKA